jgi:CheY-like chemotaxis protein
VDLANDGLEAVAVWKRLKPAIILMDCQMPELDGMDAARQIRELETGLAQPHTYIIAMTASVLESNRQHCLDAGMDEFISKPVSETDLKAAIEKGELARADQTNHAAGELLAA